MCYIGKCARATPRPALRPLAGSGRGARVKSAKLGSPPRDFPRSWTCSSRELTVRGSVDSPVGEIPWFLCASAGKLHARGPLPVKEIAIYYDRWEGEGSLCSLQDTDRDFPSFPIDTVLGRQWAMWAVLVIVGFLRLSFSLLPACVCALR